MFLECYEKFYWFFTISYLFGTLQTWVWMQERLCWKENMKEKTMPAWFSLSLRPYWNYINSACQQACSRITNVLTLWLLPKYIRFQECVFYLSLAFLDSYMESSKGSICSPPNINMCLFGRIYFRLFLFLFFLLQLSLQNSPPWRFYVGSDHTLRHWKYSWFDGHLMYLQKNSSFHCKSAINTSEIICYFRSKYPWQAWDTLVVIKPKCILHA